MLRFYIFIKLHHACCCLSSIWCLVASKYRRNFAERVQARRDVPMARAVQRSEELQIQADHMQHIEQMKAVYVCLFAR